jgi:hypothetical protein
MTLDRHRLPPREDLVRCSEPGPDRVDVGPRATFDDIPLRSVAGGEEAVVGEEREQVGRRVLQRVALTGRPHARDDGQGVVLHEVIAEPVQLEELSVGQGGGAVLVEQREGELLESPDAQQEAPERRVEDPAPLREDAPDTAAADVRQPTAVAPDAHAHLGRPDRHVELVEEAPQQRVGAVVEHDETRVDAGVLAADRHLVGVGVTAETVLAFEDRDVVSAREQVGGRQPGHAGTDHGHPWPMRHTSSLGAQSRQHRAELMQTIRHRCRFRIARIDRVQLAC